MADCHIKDVRIVAIPKTVYTHPESLHYVVSELSVVRGDAFTVVNNANAFDYLALTTSSR